MIVVDASEIVDALSAGSASRHAERLRTRLAAASGLHVPHLIDTEVQSALRGMVLGAKLSVARASDARADFDDLGLQRYPAHPLAKAVWNLRDVLTTYDATYVTLATVLGCPLVTCDRKLAKAAPAIVELF